MRVNKLKHGIFLTICDCDLGGYIAAISDGTPQRGHEDYAILLADHFANFGEALSWFEEIQRSHYRPPTRH